jgi:hypothetical protein
MTHWDPTGVPYEIHTGRELEFMLNRAKPLAHFGDYYPPEPDEDIIPQRAFAPFVSSGLFEMRAFVRLLSEPPPQRAPYVRGVLHVFYAPRQESWRIEAFMELLEAAETQPWSEHFERREGTLLGYSPAQNDAHIEHMLKAPFASDFPWLKRLLKQRQESNGTSNNPFERTRS